MNGASDRRSHNRLTTRIELECWIAGQQVQATVENLGIGGALLSAEGATCSVGDLVMLKIVGLTSLLGKVRWVDKGKVGFAFKSELHPSVVKYLGFDPDGDLREVAA